MQQFFIFITFAVWRLKTFKFFIALYSLVHNSCGNFYGNPREEAVQHASSQKYSIALFITYCLWICEIEHPEGALELFEDFQNIALRHLNCWWFLCALAFRGDPKKELLNVLLTVAEPS